MGLTSPLAPPTEESLLPGAPETLAAVVTGSMDQEDQSANAMVRIGYSGRTEKMHRFLAKTFHESRSKEISYDRVCKSQAGGRRDLIAGCFFELLVLRTNGVIKLKQPEQEGDIKISKANSWAT